MKRFIAIILALFLVSGCAGLGQLKQEPVEPPTQSFEYPMPKEARDALEEMMSKSGTNVVRAFTCLTGGTTGCLDKISVASLVDGDIGMVVTGLQFYFYQLCIYYDLYICDCF